MTKRDRQLINRYRAELGLWPLPRPPLTRRLAMACRDAWECVKLVFEAIPLWFWWML